jgi:hypothetical protein
MISTIFSGLRAWRVSLCGLVVATLLLGVPFTHDSGSQSYVWAKGGGHYSSGHKGHKARNKRHGPKRHHAKHHSAKKHRHSRRRDHHSHTTHVVDSSHHSSTTDIAHSIDFTHHHNAWDYYWGHHDYLAPDVVESEVVTPSIVTPSVIPKKVYIVKLYAPGDGKNHIEEVVGSTDEKVRERVLEKYAGADFKSIKEKAAIGGEDVYIVKFDTPRDHKYQVEDILATTGDKAKEKVLEKNSDAVVKSVEVKPVINAR